MKTRTSEAAAIVYSAAVCVASLLPGDAVSVVSGWNDKMMHGVMFALLGCLLGLSTRVPAWGAAAWMLVLGGGTEVLQRYVPGRCPETADFLWDAAGGMIGWALTRRFHRGRRGPGMPVDVDGKEETDGS